MAAPAPEAAAPPAAGGGGGGAQILQQIEDLLNQLVQSEPEPEIQQAVQGMMQQVQDLQQVVGQDMGQDQGEGLGGAPAGGGMPEPGGAGGQEEMPPSPGGAPAPEGGAGGGEGPTHEVEIHIRPTGGFKGARKAAMATHAERGHFSKTTPKGETPQSDRSKNKAKSK